MAFFAKLFKGKPKIKFRSIKSTGLPTDWHNELLTEQVFNYLFTEKNYLTDNNLIKQNIGPLWNNSKLSYKQKMKMLYDFVEETYGTAKEKEGKMMSKAAMALKQAYNAKKKVAGAVANELSIKQQYNIKHLNRQQDVIDFFNAIARIYKGGVYGSKLGSVLPEIKGKAPEYVNPTPGYGKDIFHSKPSHFDEEASADAKEVYNLDYKLPRKGTLPPPPKRKSAPLRKSSVDGKLLKVPPDSDFEQLHEQFAPPQSIDDDNDDDDFTLPTYDGGRKRKTRRKKRRKRRRKIRRKRRKSRKIKKRRTRRKYKKKTKNKRKSRKRYKR